MISLRHFQIVEVLSSVFFVKGEKGHSFMESFFHCHAPKIDFRYRLLSLAGIGVSKPAYCPGNEQRCNRLSGYIEQGGFT